MLRRTRTLSLLAASALAGAALLTVGPMPAGAAAGSIDYPRIPTSAPVTPSACAVSVGRYVARVPDGEDDTAGFTQAMADAAGSDPHCYPDGPSGDPQAVVYVPPGTYRLDGLAFPSNLRLEVSAAAVLQPTRNRPAQPDALAHSMINWDTTGKGKAAVRNVSIVGVGQDMDARKQDARAAGGRAVAGFDLSQDFTMNLDPQSADSSNYVMGMSLVNVQYFLIQNVFSVQNDTDQQSATITPWPTSSRPVLALHARRDSPLDGPYIEPMHGTITDHVNVGGPRGFGPNQINAAIDLDVSNVYTQGGTALRLETDGSMDDQGVPRIGATVDRLRASNIVGFDCNRAVSLSPHAQRNGSVTVDDVWAYSCNEGVVAAFDQDVPQQYWGTFRQAVVDGLRVYAGEDAQLDSTDYLWVVGQSLAPVQIADGLPWTPHITLVAQSGTFHRDARRPRT